MKGRKKEDKPEFEETEGRNKDRKKKKKWTREERRQRRTTHQKTNMSLNERRKG